jgi:uncharacterized protein YjbI with pentapeptide repeats
MAELKASEQGLKQIKQARDKKGWIVEDPRWLVEASKILDPKRDWQPEEGIYANGVSSGTWKAFSYNKGRKKGIKTEVFKAYCQVLGIPWEEVIEQTIENSGDSLQGNEANHLAERFNKAVQQLGSNDNYVRLSSIYDLEQIAKNAEEKYYWQVMEILTLYVRDRSPWNKEKEAKAKTEHDAPPLPDDIQKVMTVLARRKYAYGHHLEPRSLDLHGADLRRLQLPPNTQLSQINFSGANFTKTNLHGANLEKVNLQEANLDQANLQAANLEQADLQEVIFSGANLQWANLEQANLQKATFSGTELQRAILTGAHLEEANLWKANLQEASLEKADLRKANLWKANLQNANLWKANLQDTDLEEANLQSATLLEASLQRANLRRAILQDIDFTNVNLQEANLEEAELDDSFGFDLKQAFSYKGAKFSDYWSP